MSRTRGSSFPSAACEALPPRPPRARSPLLAALSCGVAALLAIASAASAGTVTVTVLRHDGKPLPGAVVMVHSLDGAAKPSAPVHAVMDQVDLMFTPDLLVIPLGSTVEFPNSDRTRHEVYSFSAAHSFQLPLYNGRPYPPVHFDKPGLVTLGCNIHDFMIAYIVVTEAAFYGTTSAAGVWSASGVPPGQYRVEIWHPRLASGDDNSERTLAVDETAPQQIEIRLEKSLRPAMLDGHMSSWDAY
jgi:plastocyanin